MIYLVLARPSAVDPAGGGTCLRRLDFSRGTVREAVLKARTDDDLNYLFEKMGVVEGA